MGYVNQGATEHRPDRTYGDVIKKIDEGGYCPFCPEHLAATHPNPVLAENAEWLATDNAYPYKNTDQHLLFIHKEHIEDISELTADGWASLNEIIIHVRGEREIRGGTLVLRFGKTAINGVTLNGASVAHLHAQITSGTGDPDAPPVLTRVG